MSKIYRLPSRAGTYYVASSYVLFSAPQIVNFLRLLPIAVIIVVTGIFWVMRSPDKFRTLRLPVSMFLVACWVLLSTLWSEDKTITFIQSTVTLSVFLIASLAAQITTPRQVVLGFALGGSAIAAVSFGLGLVVPAYGLMPPGYQEGSLRGLYVHRNLLAEALLPAFVASVVTTFDSGSRRRSIILIGLSGLGIIAARSSTALSGMLVAILVLVIVLLSTRVGTRWRSLVLYVGLVAVAVAGVIGSLFSDVVFGFLGRDSTLTGRTPIWAAVSDLISRAPLQGWGWGATWSPTDYVRRFVEASVKFGVPSAHNGYLDAAVQVGLFGLAALSLLYLYVAREGIRQTLKSAEVLASFPLLYVISLAVYNFGESSLVSTQSLFIAGLTATSWGAFMNEGQDSERRMSFA